MQEGSIADLVVEINQRFAKARLEEAEHLLRQLVHFMPQDLQAKLRLAEVCLRLGSFDRARQVADEALTIDASSVTAIMLKADALFRLDLGTDAVSLAKQLVKLQPENSVFRNNLGVYQMGIGHFQDAASSFMSAIELNESYVAPIHNLTSLPKLEITNEQLMRMKLLASKSALSDQDKAITNFCISKFYRQNGNIEEEFSYLDRAHEILAIASPWDWRSFASIVDTIEALNPEVLMRFQEPRCMRPSGIFISSMPRSGSTLLDQSIAAHPEVRSLGESGIATQAVRHAVSIMRFPMDELWTWVKRSDAQHLFASLFEKWHSTLDGHRLDSPWYIEKSINNDVFLGVCLLANPANKIVYCQRNPLDTCLSNYQTYFAKGMDFSHKLSWLAKRYEFHQRIMAYWTDMFPDRILQVSYESLVANPRSTLERVLEFVGLPWSEECLQSQEIDSNVRSASNWQVRQPLYQTSVGRWRRYEQQLAAIMHLNKGS